MADEMILIRDAGHSYDGTRWQYRGLNLNVMPGEIVAILGPNGRGKSTLLRSIVGLNRPNQGTIRTNGLVGFVPQDFSAAFPYSVLDIVLMGRARHVGAFRSPGRRDSEIARGCLDALGLTQFSDRSFDSLSGGERQLVLIARALATEAPILLLDEPASALDLRNQDLVLGFIHQLGRAQGLTILFTTHQPNHALAAADRALLMNDGEHYQIGDLSEVLTESNLAALYHLPVSQVRYDHEDVELTTFAPTFRSQVERARSRRNTA
ncbi:MAG TPA: ABC transporter ATP-binding protein [Bosea sp. (in: a-proteobacteria)]|jgi:iron complex transport system ATP-binding protein|uniref:ABC transporter ATP-binding protein n=1 Tax=Bosea sp. (in: a-proteobacteria) TaxID=1871050 RepID=UPI002E13405C|nr:ABC transporter ATP-binding protein [Bosea sp. (in: a-proteobacteria)]